MRLTVIFFLRDVTQCDFVGLILSHRTFYVLFLLESLYIEFGWV